jgi:hypothetical protein
MNTYKKLEIKKLATAFFLAICLFFTASNSVLAVANQSETTYPSDEERLEGLLYSNSNKAKSLDSVNDFISPQRQKELLDPTQIPAKKQPAIDRSDPDNKLLEKTAQMFKDAGNFSAN